jgi:hypothetical protein
MATVILSTQPFIINPSGGNNTIISGGSSNITTTSGPPIDTTTLGGGWTTPPYLLPSYFTQIAGFNQMLPCDYADCRDSSCPRPLPVFGTIGSNGPSYTNDVTSYFIVAPYFTPTIQIQKQNQKWFGNNGAQGQWTTMASIVDNSYGIYYPVGKVPNNPTWAGFQANWGLIVNAFGPGIYRITATNCTVTHALGSQASYTYAIANMGFPKLITGTFTIGTTVLTLNYGGSYLGYLAYLTALINSTPNYTAVNTGSGVTISGTNYALSNGINISQTLTYTGRSFLATSPSTYSLTGTSPLDKNPMPFPNISYNYGGLYNASTYKYVSDGTDPVQDFLVKIYFQGGATKAAQFVSVSATINIYKNSVLVGSTTNTYPNQNNAMSMTEGVAGVSLINGDVVCAEVIIAVTTNPAGQSATMIIEQPVIEFWNVSEATNTTDIGTLSGGINGTTTTICSCAYASNPVLAQLWDCDLARGTVKFESNISGTIGDAYNDGVLFEFNGFVMYDSIRVWGYFGKEKPMMEEIINEWGVSTSKPFGTQEKTRAKEIPNNTFFSDPVPFYVYKGLMRYGLMPGGMVTNILVSDYNSNNANYFIMQKSQKMKGSPKTTHYNKAHFPKNQMWKNRCLSFEVEFEDGIQSGIASS